MNPAKDFAIISGEENYLRSDGERDTNICSSDFVIFTSVHLIFELFLNLHNMCTGCPRRNGQNFGRVFLMLKYADITQNTYIQS